MTGKWTPRTLIAPDGREYTPSSRGEEVRLRTGHGYRPKTDLQPRRQDPKTAQSTQSTESEK